MESTMSKFTTTTTLAHKDKLGRVIDVDSFVAFPTGNHLEFGKVAKLTTKMVHILRLPINHKRHTLKYPAEVVLLPSADMTWFLLKS
jgi:hypothetical protein